MEGTEDKSRQLEPQRWVERYADYLYKFAYFRVNNTALAEDLVQDTFLSGISARATYRGQASEKTWLVAILKNKIIDHYKKASTKNESPLQLRSEEAPSLDHFFDKKRKGQWQNEAAPADWGEHEKKMESSEFYKVLGTCMAALPLKWQGIFKMSLLDEEDSSLVCKEFSLSSSNFWVIMHRAKLQIRECLEKNWVKV